MFNLNAYLKISLNLFLIFSITTILYYTFETNSGITEHLNSSGVKLVRFFPRENKTETYNVWFIFTKVSDRSPLTLKFKALLINMLNLSSVPLHLHLLVDNSSKNIAKKKVMNAMRKTNKTVLYSFYDVKEAAEIIEDVVNVMMPHFSSKPGILLIFLKETCMYNGILCLQALIIVMPCFIYLWGCIKLHRKSRIKPLC